MGVFHVMLARKDLQIDINVKRTFFSSSLNLAHSILVPSKYSIHASLPPRENEGEVGMSQALPTDARNQSEVRREGD